VVHEAVPACFLAVHWWATSVDLFQRYFRAEHGSPERLVEVESATIGCVWELAVVAHERDASGAALLGNADRPDYDGYLDSWLRGTTESRTGGTRAPR
jgi:hypothetical protein